MNMRDTLKEVEEFNHTKEELDEGFLAFLRTGAITLNTTKGIQTEKNPTEVQRTPWSGF
jgi:hypothetical protein